ncbi:MFS transporter [Limosilactobacillus sp.]|uniref:MFS transporter n=1 Tax=Limosilactobacillus sp. TaxID=2773925 RepID=UPI003EFDC8A8
MRKYPIIFFMIMFVAGLNSFMVSAFLPILAKYFAVSTTQSGYLVSSFAVGDALTALIAGPLSDGRDRKKVLIFGLALFVLATLGCGLATSFTIMMLFEFISGIAAAFITPQVFATIPTVVAVGKVTQLMGFATAGLSSSQIIGVPLGSYLAVFSWRVSYLCLSVMALILIAVVYFGLPSTEVNYETSKHSFLSNLREVIKNPSARKMLLTYAAYQLGSATTIAFTSTWFNQDFGLNLSQIGTATILIGCGRLLGSLLSSRVIGRWGFNKTARIEFSFLIFIYLIVPFSPNVVVADIILALVFTCNGLLFPLLMTSLEGTVKNARSTISSLANCTIFLAQTIAGIIGGFLFNNFSGFFGIAIFSALVIGLGLIYGTKNITD